MASKWLCDYGPHFDWGSDDEMIDEEAPRGVVYGFESRGLKWYLCDECWQFIEDRDDRKRGPQGYYDTQWVLDDVATVIQRWWRTQRAQYSCYANKESLAGKAFRAALTAELAGNLHQPPPPLGLPYAREFQRRVRFARNSRKGKNLLGEVWRRRTLERGRRGLESTIAALAEEKRRSSRRTKTED